MTRRSSGLSNKRINCGSFLAQFILIRYELHEAHAKNIRFLSASAREPVERFTNLKEI
uniref:Uncharacterized protein n=1 Tax=Candidatus Kentrum sp. DK TaxID=2126562 RepID=A0A450S175_9GAMM|nr:MAG: hypothetical protein BECKDK2373C_GA0170839_10113 [Candidatus Kentron sp. DK]